MNKPEILVLSPHLDDAVLSCTDHILDWRKSGNNVTVDTLFSGFDVATTSSYQQKFIQSLHFQSCYEYGQARKQEDVQAMKMLDVNYNHANFTDAGFRLNKQSKPLYASYQALTPFKVDDHSEALLKLLIMHLSSHQDPSMVLVPMGVGGHIDHMLVKEAARSVFDRKILSYYIEFPYGLRIWKYRTSMLHHVKCRRLSRKLITNKKRQILNVYQTQIKNLFKGTLSYSESLLLSNSAIVD